jgi:hypothetical protein
MRGIIMIIVLEGSDGTGKTFLAKEFCEMYDARYIHAGYKFKDKQFTYHTAIIHQALEHIKKTGQPVVIDRWWISESVYAEVYRGGTRWPLMGRFMDRILRKAGGVYVFCLHDGGINDYAEKFKDLKKNRKEMYDDPSDIAAMYKELWSGAYKSGYDTHANQIAENGGFSMRDDCFKYSINEQGKNVKKFCAILYNKIKCHDLLESDNFSGGFADSKILMVGDEVSPTRKGKLSWPFHKYSNSGLYITRWLHENNVDEKDLAWCNIHEVDGTANIDRYLDLGPERKIVCLGADATRTFKARFRNHKCFEVIHPQAAARFPFNQDKFDRQMNDALK